MEPTYELYYNTEYKRKYYYDPASKKSLWEMPADGKVVDKRSEEEKKLDEPKVAIKVIQPDEAEHKKLAELYPDFFKNRPTDVQAKSKKNKKKEAAGEGKEEDEAIPVPEEQEESESDPEENEEKKKKYKQFRSFKKQQVGELMKRPARRQIKEIKKDTAYLEGNYDYNIWYDKYLTDRRNEQEKAPSLYKCNPELDTGYTRADLMEKNTGYFCVYFARGCCIEGPKCRYYHRIPQPEDLIFEENSKDVFGRTRHATFKYAE